MMIDLLSLHPSHSLDVMCKLTERQNDQKKQKRTIIL